MTSKRDINIESLAKAVWGLDWQAQLPRMLRPGLELRLVDYATAHAFAAEHFPKIYGFDKNEGLLFDAEQSLQTQKQRYYETCGDFFLLHDADAGPVGLAVGSLLDWSSYNFRNMAIVPAFQGQGLYGLFFDFLCNVLSAHSVRRIEGDVAPTNRHHIHAFNKMGYCISALSVSERFGAALHITKFLDPADEKKFGKLFCASYGSDAQHNEAFSGDAGSPRNKGKVNSNS